jgi:hypothetical protein
MGLTRYELGTAFPGVIRRTTERLIRARRRLSCCGLRQVRMIVLDGRGITNWAAWEQHPPDRLVAVGHAHGRGGTCGRKPGYFPRSKQACRVHVVTPATTRRT